MESLGAQLKLAREERNLSLHEIAVRTKISASVLEALERDDFSKLPGGIFGRSFVRSYAAEVGADPDEAVRQFVKQLERAEREAAERRAARRAAVTPDDRRFLERQRLAFAGLRVAIILLVVVVVVVAVWQIRAYSRRTSAAQAPAASAPVAAVAPIPPPASELASAEPADTPAPAAVATPVASENAAIVVGIDVSADCWLSVSVDGNPPSAQLFRAGDARQFQADREIVLDVGNAGALHLTINGKTARPLGRDGAHVRTRITPDNIAEFLQ